MTRHAELIELSSYLDGELHDELRHELEAHVRSCASCRQRLAGLERTVGRLREVGRESPPGRLASQIHHRLIVEHRRPGRLQAIERWLAEWRPTPALIASAALVVALAAILQIFVTGGAILRQREQATEAPPPPAAPAPQAEEQSLEPSGDARAAVASRPREHILVLGDRRFQLRRGAWIEESVLDREPDHSLTWAEARAEGLVAAAPELEPLVDGPRPVVLLFQDEVVRVTDPEPPPD
ncbi:MAG: anti-sigma factor family protein [Thermoanaerobaculia bacterium]